ncbi:MAG: helix-hairpin-helix domain-containing protein [Anaeromyxobacteraceae bacterium]
MRRLALASLLAAAVAEAPIRAWLERPEPRPPCAAPEGRGRPPRGWLGCATDPGEGRPLAQDERLALGLPVDPNRAGVRELADLPGLSPALARAIVEDRERNGPFARPEELLRVRGIGRVRLERARPHLAIGSVAAPAGVE